MNYWENEDPGREKRTIRKELRNLFKLFPTLSYEDVDLAINFFLDYFHFKPEKELEEFKLKVINRLIREKIILEDEDLEVFYKVDTDGFYSEEIPLVLRFNLFLISLHKKGRIRFQDGFYIYEEGEERALILPLPYSSPKHPYYLEECISHIKSNLPRKHKKLYLFKNENLAQSTLKVFIKEGIHFDRNNLFFFNKADNPTRFIQVSIKEEAYRT